MDALRNAAAADYGPIERHSLRVFFIMEMMARATEVRIDREVAICAALLHVYWPVPGRFHRPSVYLRDGRRYAGRVLEHFGWSSTG